MRPVAALLVMSRERRSPLLKSLKLLDIEVLAVETCQQARGLLQTHPPVDVVITQVTLPDGNWCDVFKYLVDNGVQASLIVSSPHADEILFSEVLWRGAYDLIVEPYQADELRKTLEGALRAKESSRIAAATMAGGMN
jgi:DNA-binding NtrC family response regulator